MSCPTFAAGGEKWRWVDAILSGKVAELRCDGYVYLELPAGVTWPTFESNKLFVRELYGPLFRDVLKGCSRRAAAGAIIIGSPGIGKSAFGLFILFEAVKEGRTVIYQFYEAGCAIIISSKDRSFRTLASADVQMAAEIHDCSSLYICDGDEHYPSDAYKVLIVSPDNKRTDWPLFWEIGSVNVHMMPPFTAEETRALFELAFKSPSYSEQRFRELLEKWGANPRNVLEMADDERWQRKLDEQAISSDIAALTRAINRGVPLEAACSRRHEHRLLELVPLGAMPGTTLSFAEERYYLPHRTRLPSAYVRAKYDAAVREADEELLIRPSGKRPAYC